MSNWGICSDSQIRAQSKYDSQHTTRISLKLNLHTDQDIIQWLWKQKSMQGSIKQLIRKELEHSSTSNDIK